MQVCVYLVQSYIASPAFEQVNEQCTYTYYAASAMRDDFVSCASDGMNACASDFSRALQGEVDRVSAIDASNQQVVQTAGLIAGECAASLSAATTVLDSWVHGGPATRPLLFLPSCSTDQRRVATSLVNPQDSYSAPSAVSVSTEVQAYSAATQAFLLQLSAEIQAMRSGYESSLAASSYTASMVLAQGMGNMSQASEVTLNATMVQVDDSLSQLLACVGGASTSQEQCAYGSSLFALYAQQKAFVDAQQQAVAANQLQIATAVAAYESQVVAVAATFSQFYQSIVGPNGLIGRFSAAMNQLGVTVDTCGLTSPSWCSLSSTFWTVSVPYLSYVPLTSITSPEALWNSFETQQAPAMLANLTETKRQALNRLQQQNGATSDWSQRMLNASAASAAGVQSSSDTLILAQGRALDAFQRNVTNAVNSMQNNQGGSAVLIRLIID